jgi:hypothetical protein
MLKINTRCFAEDIFETQVYGHKTLVPVRYSTTQYDTATMWELLRDWHGVVRNIGDRGRGLEQDMALGYECDTTNDTAECTDYVVYAHIAATRTTYYLAREVSKDKWNVALTLV